MRNEARTENYSAALTLGGGVLATIGEVAALQRLDSAASNLVDLARVAA